MNHTHFPNTIKYYQKFLFDRYKTVGEEQKPTCRWENISIDKERIRLTDILGSNFITETVHNMCKIVRIEPENPYQLHRVIPSARNLSSNFLQLFVSNQQKFTDIFEFDFIAGDFIYSGTLNKNICNNFVLATIYNNRNIDRMYGKFGFVLSLLDAGHQINYLEEIINLELEVEYFPNWIRGVQKNALASIKIESEIHKKYLDNIENIVQVPYLISYRNDHKIENDELEDLFKDFCSEIDNDKIEITRKMRKENFDYELDSMKRTSLQSYHGLMFTRNDKSTLSVILPHNTKYLDNLEMVVLDYANSKIYGSSKDIAEINREQILFDSHEYVNLLEVQVIILIVIKEGNYSPKEISAGFIQAGEWMNLISTYYTSQNKVTRCLRNIDDYYVKKNIIDCDYVTYMLMVGENDIDTLLKGDL
jgi:hypothetical protein